MPQSWKGDLGAKVLYALICREACLFPPPSTLVTGPLRRAMAELIPSQSRPSRRATGELPHVQRQAAGSVRSSRCW